jgi:transcription elongation factor Elf1
MMMIIYSEFPLLGKMFSCLRCRAVTVVQLVQQPLRAQLKAADLSALPLPSVCN